MTLRRACAKINLGLRVLRRRSDGYHDISTVFVRIGWADKLDVAPADTFSFSCSDPSLPVDDSNLVVQAVRKFESASGIRLNRRIHLEKVLPHGSGLGGGSSDAACMLSICSEVASREHGVDVGSSDLHDIAASLGADVPFFLSDGPQIGSGTGIDLAPLYPDPETHLALPIVVVAPDVFISSGLAYQRLAPREIVDGESLPAEIVRSRPQGEWRRLLVNDFEPAVFDAFPQVRRIKDQIEETGATYAAMSGSGSAVFGIYETDEQAQQAAASLRQHTSTGNRVWYGRTE